MADVLAVRNECRAQAWAMLIQECDNSGLDEAGVLPAARDLREEFLLLASEAAQSDG